MANTQPQNNSLSTVPSDRLWLRSELMGTQVITRDTGRRLGLVGEVVVDIDRREVVALGLRDNPLTRFLPGLPRWMPLDRIRQVGDVILVDSVDSLSETFSPERFSKVINCQVITESGQQLGRVLGFSFDIETGDLTTLVTGALGVPLLGEGVLSTWEIPVEEIVSSGADRIIVYEGAEDKLKQLNTGVLEKLGIGGSSWEEQERDRYRVNLVPVENQLTSGDDYPEEVKKLSASSEDIFQEEEEFEYVELENRREDLTEKRRYIDDSMRDYSQDEVQYQGDIRGIQEERSQLDNSYIKNFESNQTKKIARKRSLKQEPIDVEPLTSLDSKKEDNDKSKSVFDTDEIEDPW